MSKPPERSEFEPPERVERRKHVEASLLQSEARHRDIIQTAMDGFWLTDMQGRLLEVNGAYCRMSGYSAQELLTMRIADLEAIETGDDIERRIQEITDGGEWRFETRHRRKDGSIIDVEVSAKYRPVEGGRMVVFLRDITEHRHVRTALAQSEQLLRHLTDNLPNAVVYQLIAEPDGGRRFTFVSRAVERLNEVTVAQVLADANAIYQQVLPEYLEVVRQREAQALAHLTPLRVTVQSRLPSGRLRWFEYTSTPRHQADGRLVWDGVEVDVTEHHESEAAIKKSEEKFAKAFKASPVPVSINAMEDGKYVEVNEVFLNTIGFQREQVIGRTSTELGVWVGKGDRRRFVEALSKKGSLQNFPLQYRMRSGEIRDFLMFSERIELEGKPCSLNFNFDITERKRAEEEKAKLEAQLQQAQKMESVGRLAGGVAHDFNNMLGVILGYAEIALSQVNPSDPMHADLEEIVTAAQRSAKITRQLLAFARKQTVAPRVLDLNETVAGMNKMLARLVSEEIQLDWRPDPELWLVKVDPNQIEQVLANLCVNARDAIAGAGRITIATGNASFEAEQCAARPEVLPGEYVFLAVSDDGCGMDPATLAHIFEPFFTTKGVGEGTGLGLAMVYGAVQQNNGFVTAKSAPGLGATFTIYLPRYLGEMGPAQLDDGPGALMGGRETILLVEDEAAILTLTTKMLQRRGYTVLAARTPEEAGRLAENHPGRIDLLLTDVIMPGTNGRALWQRLSHFRPDLKCLFMSGYPADAIADRGMLDEGAHFIQKPFAKKQLAVKVRQALDWKT
jgi:PAS domain S-box-containing protein